MEKIFEGEIYEIVEKPDGLVFSYLKGTDEDNLIVGFKMISVENKTITDVAKNIYLLAKFGVNYKTAVALCDNYITVNAVNLPGGSLFLCTQSGEAYLIDASGEAVWTGELKYRGVAPSSVVYAKNALWACFSEGNVLIRFNHQTMREELRIGGKRSPFDSPRDIFADGNTAFVSNFNSKTITKVNLESFAVEEYYDFDEGVRAYMNVNKFEFVLLETGLYSF